MATNHPGPAPEQFGIELQYGCPVVDLGSGDCICQSFSLTQAADLKEYKDENGNVCTLVQVGPHEEFTMDLLVATGTTAKKPGESFTFSFGGTSYTARVQTWQESWSNEDVTKVNITARTYPSIP